MKGIIEIMEFIKKLIGKNKELKKHLEEEAVKLENALKGELYSHALYKLRNLTDLNLKDQKQLVMKLEKTSQKVREVIQ